MVLRSVTGQSPVQQRLANCCASSILRFTRLRRITPPTPPMPPTPTPCSRFSADTKIPIVQSPSSVQQVHFTQFCAAKVREETGDEHVSTWRRTCTCGRTAATNRFQTKSLWTTATELIKMSRAPPVNWPHQIPGVNMTCDNNNLQCV